MIVVGVDLSGPSNPDANAAVVFRGNQTRIRKLRIVEAAGDEEIWELLRSLPGAPVAAVRTFKKRPGARRTLLAWLERQGMAGARSLPASSHDLVAACGAALPRGSGSAVAPPGSLPPPGRSTPTISPADAPSPNMTDSTGTEASVPENPSGSLRNRHVRDGAARDPPERLRDAPDPV
jgi:hypothetical protein